MSTKSKNRKTEKTPTSPASIGAALRRAYPAASPEEIKRMEAAAQQDPGALWLREALAKPDGPQANKAARPADDDDEPEADLEPAELTDGEDE